MRRAPGKMAEPLQLWCAARPERRHAAAPRGEFYEAGTRFLCRLGHEVSPSVHKKAPQHRIGAMLTSENKTKAKFGEQLFYEVG